MHLTHELDFATLLDMSIVLVMVPATSFSAATIARWRGLVASETLLTTASE